MRDFRVNRTQPALTWTVDFLSQKVFFSALGGGCLVPPQSRTGEKRTGPQVRPPSPPTPCSLTITSTPALPFLSQDTPPPNTHIRPLGARGADRFVPAPLRPWASSSRVPPCSPVSLLCALRPQGEPFETGVYFEVKERQQQWGSFPGAARGSGRRQHRSHSRRNRKLSQSPLPPRVTANQSTGC